MALGKFTIPSDKTLAGDENKKPSGDGTAINGLGDETASGLQPEFVLAIEELVADAKEAGITIETGSYGFLSASLAQELDKSQSTSFYETNLIYFGWGLALLISYLDGDNCEKWLTDNELSYGVRMMKSGSFRFFLPKNVTRSDDVDDISYSDVDETGTGSSGSVASVAYFFSNAFTETGDITIATMLTGDRALANDVPLWDTIKSLCSGTMRSIMSMGDGSIVAFYPDYFGLFDEYNATPYLTIEDIDLVDLNIEQSDTSVCTHVYCPGTQNTGDSLSSDDLKYLYTMGAVSIETAVEADKSEGSLDDEYYVSDKVSPLLEKLINIPDGEEWKYTPKEIYRRYGARPVKKQSLVGSAKLIENLGGDVSTNIMPFLAALYEFMNQWSQQYSVKMTTTFHPAVFPGCRVYVKSLDLYAYVESVSHNMSYANGFTTALTCKCWSGSLLSGMVNPDGGGE